MAVVEFRDITKRYGEVTAVRDISMRVEQGEIFAILGPSGSGKSTILRLIAGLEAPDRGRILINNRTVAEEGRVFLPPEERRIGMVFQDYALFPHLTVRKNIASGLLRLNRKKRQVVVDRMLRFIGMGGMESRYPHELSGGQQQRVALARALAPSPVVILLDEPFSSLDDDLRARTRDETRMILREINATAILVTHNQDEALAIADRIAVMNQGRIEQIASPDVLYHLPETRFVADFVGQADFIEGVITMEGIRTELGVLQDDTSFSEGTRVEVMLRPEDLWIMPDEKGVAVVVNRYFKGSENIYALRLPSGRMIHSSAPSTLVIGPGSRVRVEMIPEHVVAFKDGVMAGRKKEGFAGLWL